MTINNNYIIELAEKIKADIHTCVVSGEQVAIGRTYRRDKVVYVETERVFFDGDIVSVQLLKKDKSLIMNKDVVLRTASNEKVKLTIPIELEETVKGDDSA